MSHKPEIISRQLRLAQQRGRQGLAGLEATSRDGDIPIDPNVIQALRETYALLRSASAGLGQAQRLQKFPDPVLDLTYKRVTHAWDLSRVAVDQLSWGNTRQEYLAKAIPTLTEALHILNVVIVTMP